MSIFSKNEIEDLENYENFLDLENKSKKNVFAKEIKSSSANVIDETLEQFRKEREETIKENQKKQKGFLKTLLNLFGF